VFQFGIDRLRVDPSPVEGLRVALLSHPAGVDSRLAPSWRVLEELPGVRLTRLFGPEHGIDGGAQDMVAVGDAVHPETGLPARSLYGASAESLSPRPEDLADVDVLVCDLQDVGARYYTFAWTLALAMEACAVAGKPVVVCDRPNPLGRAVEGERPEEKLRSFVGLHPVPVRHGLTIGELARLYARDRRLDVDLRIVAMRGWAGSVGWPDERPWIPPSPNMPTLDTARVYPGGCLVEATNLSEGRGTTRPFEQVGAPFLDAAALAKELAGLGLPGVAFRPAHFRPAFHKFAGRTCHGIFLQVTDREVFRPYETGLRLIEAARRLSGGSFAWRSEPYEFDSRPAIDLLTGSTEVRRSLDERRDVEEFCRRQRHPAFDPGDARLYPDERPACLGIAGPHDSGKTTILERLVPLLKSRGLSVGAVKHTPHDVEDDEAGKDSDRLRRCGADPSAFARPSTTTVRRGGPEELSALLRREFSGCDVVLVEGYKALPLRRVEVGRTGRFRVEFRGRDYTDDLPGLARAVLEMFRLPGAGE
jgi:molybdopterin-guanine dinucleotide biosynthesis protein MobB